MSNNIFNNFCFFPWNPYFKTDGTNLFFLFSIKETKQHSMKILWNDSIKYVFDRSYVRYLANDLRLSKAEKVSCYVFLVTRGQGLSFYTHAMLCIQDDKQSN